MSDLGKQETSKWNSEAPRGVFLFIFWIVEQETGRKRVYCTCAETQKKITEERLKSGRTGSAGVPSSNNPKG